MGRYYTGDIEGKFWFGVQASDDADFFGVNGEQPQELNYYFDKDDAKEVLKGIKTCEKKLGKYLTILNPIFSKEDYSYSPELLAKELNLSKEKFDELLQWYARMELGKKIYECILKNGYCSFTAEC